MDLYVFMQSLLQMLGCIPRSPSPERSPDISFSEVIDKDAKIRDLEVSQSNPIFLLDADMFRLA